ncbi:histidine phosphatase superfamily [Pseudoneurospora amorphoporcata]|uniref:3-phytase n=1 Tax=Pseudoneurospora amorphoporcata TaxID=241081 RepID=A0AAN6P311_9PEZI|nr:histidine phosphatase superfamily [Pseudoneurospora amorphoporcata]
MTSLTPRPPYTDDELQKLYPPGLQLQQVQILMRHGERTPVTARFQNAGLKPFWPYCASVRQMRSIMLDYNGQNKNKPQDPITGKTGDKDHFHTVEWKRRLETFGPNDEPVVAKGPGNELDDVCDFGALTDLGRQSTSRLGMRLRKLYVDRLGFLPETITSTDEFYLRSTNVPRALESMHQTFQALYPPSSREADPKTGKFPVPTVLTRGPGDETLYPNDGNCRRFAALSRAFAQRAADRWNATEEMEYLNKVYGKWMPANSPRVAVDSRPRLSGIMDTVNASLAHGPETRLPEEFYDYKARKIMEMIASDEWFAGFNESREYRMLGMGALLGDVVGRMVSRAERTNSSSSGASTKSDTSDPSASDIKFGLSGCHDTTLAGMLSSLGAHDSSSWPPFTSHIAIELFRKADSNSPSSGDMAVTPAKRGWWESMFPGSAVSSSNQKGASGICRKSTEYLTSSEKSKLDGYYVRMRYNDEPVTIPGCKAPGNHLEGDESFCTLSAFKSIVDKFTPQDWKQQCRMNVDQPATPPSGEPEWAGHP